MKGFIEVTYPTSNVKYCVNVNFIAWFVGIGKTTSIMFNDGTRFNVSESYDEIAAKIEAATCRNG